MNQIKSHAHVAHVVILVSDSTIDKTLVANAVVNQSNVYKNSIFSFLTPDTTRERRGREIERVHYNFLSKDEFIERKEKDYYLESDEVDGHFYGTSREEFYENVKNNKVTLLKLSRKSLNNLLEQLSGYNVIVFNLVKSCSEDFEEVPNSETICFENKNLAAVSLEIYRRVIY